MVVVADALPDPRTVVIHLENTRGRGQRFQCFAIHPNHGIVYFHLGGEKNEVMPGRSCIIKEINSYLVIPMADEWGKSN